MRVDLPVYKQPDFWGVGTRTLTSFFNGQAAVLFFFVLSGFVLSRSFSIRHRRLNARFYIIYGLRRIFRIYPAHVVVLFLWIAAMISLGRLGLTPLYDEKSLLPAYRDLYGIYMAAGNWPSLSSFFQNVALRSWTINPATWSLCVEVFANIFLPAMFIFANTRELFQKIIVLLGLTYLLCNQMYSNFFLAYLAPFYIGVLVGEYGECVIGYLESAMGPRCLLIVIVILFLLPMPLTENRPAIVLICETCASWLTVAFISTRPNSNRISFLDHSLMRHIGRLSYTIYLCNFLVMVVLLRALHSFWGHTPSRFVQALWVIPFIICCFALTLIFSYTLHRLVEMPGLALGRYLVRALEAR